MSLYSFVKELEFNSTKTDRMLILKSSKKCILKFHYYAIYRIDIEPFKIKFMLSMDLDIVILIQIIAQNQATHT